MEKYPLGNCWCRVPGSSASSFPHSPAPYGKFSCGSNELKMGRHGQRAGMLPARGWRGWAGTIPLATFEVVGSHPPNFRGSDVSGEGSVPGTSLQTAGSTAPSGCRDAPGAQACLQFTVCRNQWQACDKSVIGRKQPLSGSKHKTTF